VNKEETIKKLKRTLLFLKEEEANLGRLLITGKISEKPMINYDLSGKKKRST
jgi:hypothetical protein